LNGGPACRVDRGIRDPMPPHPAVTTRLTGDTPGSWQNPPWHAPGGRGGRAWLTKVKSAGKQGRTLEDLFEHQAKELFAEYGIPVPRGKVAHTAEEACAAAAELTGRVVVKAQVKTGGRGKAGGVKLAEDADDAYRKATEILGMDIKGHTVHKVLIEEASAIAEEYYFSFLLDRANRTFLAICSASGGMDIEEVAHAT